jgi:hypothetical protein
MNLTLPIDLYKMEQEKSDKVITFSTSSILAIKNIPSDILAFILLPVYVCFFVPVIYFLLWKEYKGVVKSNAQLHRNVKSLNYNEAKQVYDNLSSTLNHLENTIGLIQKAKADFFLKGIFKIFLRIESVTRNSKNTVGSTLFYSIAQPPLSTEEKQLFSELNAIWGNDDDGVYALSTHYHLTHGI